jgi:DNA-binding Xre family transcriptional regulator
MPDLAYIRCMTTININKRDDLTWNWPELARLQELAGFRSKTALAEAAGMQRQEFRRIKTGQCSPTTYTIAKLCRVLNCQPGDILRYK